MRHRQGGRHADSLRSVFYFYIRYRAHVMCSPAEALRTVFIKFAAFRCSECEEEGQIVRSTQCLARNLFPGGKARVGLKRCRAALSWSQLSALNALRCFVTDLQKRLHCPPSHAKFLTEFIHQTQTSVLRHPGLCGCLAVHGATHFDCPKVHLALFFVGISEGSLAWRVYVEGGSGRGYPVTSRCM